MVFPLNLGLQKARLPLILVKMYDTDICLLLDTGSSVNLLDERIFDYFQEILPEIDLSQDTQKTVSLYGTSEGVRVNIPFTFENQEYNEPFISSDLCPAAFDKISDETGMRIHGILGTNFLMKHEWVLDFKKMEVYS